MQIRIKRDFRPLSPTQFFNYVMKVKRCMTDNANYSQELLGTSYAFLLQFFTQMVLYEKAYQLASNYDRVRIRERDHLAEELKVTLDELASAIEAASMRNPDALYTTGFNIAGERRSTTRPKPNASINHLAPEDHSDSGQGMGSSQ